MQPKKKKANKSYFCVSVKVIECRYLPDRNMDSMVTVEVGKERRQTGTVRGTDSPYFNDYFVFDLETTLEGLFETMVRVSVVQPRKRFRVKRLLGCISMDVGTIWARPERRLNNWLSMTLPSDPLGHENGQVRCELRVEAAEGVTGSQLGKRHPEDVLGKQRARYMVRLYRCEGLRKSELNIVTRDNPDVSITVSFAGQSGSTTGRPLQDTMHWNEQITFTEMYPPLFHKITIELLSGKVPQFKKVFNINELWTFFDSITLLSFGPSYAHIYVNEFGYRVSVLISISCELISVFRQSERMHRVTMQTVPPPLQSLYGFSETFLCYGVIFGGVLFGSSHERAVVKYSLSIGKVGRQSISDELNQKTTAPYKTSAGIVSPVHIQLKNVTPCLIIRSDWPDTHSRLINSNLIINLIESFEKKVTDVENMINRGIHFKTAETISYAMNVLQKDVLKIKKMFSKGITDLDHEYTKFMIRQLECIASNRTINKDECSLLKNARDWLKILHTISQQVQESLPFIILILRTGKSILGISKLHPRDFYYSKRIEKKGKYCGKIIPILMSDPTNVESYVARVDIWMWLGLWDQVSDCIKQLPTGHQDMSEAIALPVMLTYDTDNSYYAVCHIFQGIISGFPDQCNTVVKVSIGEHNRRTRVVKKSIAPIWRSTLVFERLNSLPSLSYLLDNPPLFTVELWNFIDESLQLIGTTTAESVIKLEPQPITAESILEWIAIGSGSEILAAFEMFHMTEEMKSYFENNNLESSEDPRHNILRIGSIDLSMNKFRLELVFWGIRWLDIGILKKLSQPQVVFECGSNQVQSDVITNANRIFNFKHDLKIVEIALPQYKLYSPPIVVRVKNVTGFIGSDMDKNLYQHVVDIPSKKEWRDLTTTRKSAMYRAQKRFSSVRVTMPDLIPLVDTYSRRRSSSLAGSDKNIKKRMLAMCDFVRYILKICIKVFQALRINSMVDALIDDEDDEEEFDWWSKYYSGDIKKFEQELEYLDDFGGFSDVLNTFIIKQSINGELKEVAKVKIMLCIYEWPTEIQMVNFQGLHPDMGVLQQSELSDGVKLLVRVYCVKAYDLHPADLSGKADPYIEIATESTRVSDKDSHISRELNPVFGKCYEITATFPKDYSLAVRVMDWDRFSTPDLIGETLIDLENRYYSKHRATCGLSSKYSEAGFNFWRDVEKPTEILEKLCNIYNLPLPQYYDKSILLGSKEFYIEKKISKNLEEIREMLALNVLQNWQQVPLVGRRLVPEHVETRTLFHPSRPGVPQGKLEMWVDMFDLTSGNPPPPLDISRRQPQPYELRVIIWNTAKVPLVDSSYFVGKNHTDIFVKGWLCEADKAQCTDVHYTSLNGDGYFNWRFVFPFSYLKQERKMVIIKKGIFDIEKSEEKMPALLHLQVWDSDRIAADEFIGSLVMDLSSMPRGAKSKNACKIRETPESKRVNLFKVKHMRGWWPFVPAKMLDAKKGAGVLEAEFLLLTKNEAVANPAGLGRAEPQALPAPDRPEVRLGFWMAPFRVLFQLTCKAHKGKMLMGACICAVVMFIVVGVYSIPLFLIKRIIDSN